MMTFDPFPENATACPSCGFPIDLRDKSGGQVTITLVVRPGVSIDLQQPICGACTWKCRSNQERAVAVLRAACAGMLAPDA